MDIELVKTHHALHVTGIDVEAEVLIRARELTEKYKLQNAISLLKVKPGAFPFADAEFDVVFSKDSIIHIQDKHALMNEVYRVLKPGGCFLASDWLMSTSQVSDAMRDYIAAEGLGFQMACPQIYHDAMLQAGFSDISIVSRNQWYRVQARSELELLKGQTGNTAAEKYGRAFIDEEIHIWQRMLVVLNSGELCPSHLNALKPLQA